MKVVIDYETLYGNLLPISEGRIGKIRAFYCQCLCGRLTKVTVYNLVKGNTKSCGCLATEATRRMGLSNITHGFSYNKLYSVWRGMKERCLNKRFKHYDSYGGRGITICDEWRNSFEAFQTWALANGYQEGLQIDRRNNNGNYEPSNCRFVTATVNSRNRRSTVMSKEIADLIRLQISNHSQGELASIYGVGRTTIQAIIENRTWI